MVVDWKRPTALGVLGMNVDLQYLHTVAALPAGVWSDGSIRRSAIDCYAWTVVCSRDPGFFGQHFKNIQEHLDLRLQAKLLFSPNRLADVGKGLAEQLKSIKHLPQEEQFETA